MSYGAVIRNGSNEIIIDSDHDSFAKNSSTTMSSTRVDNSFFDPEALYRFTPPTQSTSFPALIFLPLANGDKVGIDGPFGAFLRNDTNGSAIICNPASNISLPSTGFGMRIFKSDGSVSYSSEIELGRVFDKSSASLDTIINSGNVSITINSNTTHVAVQVGGYVVQPVQQQRSVVQNVVVERTGGTSAIVQRVGYSIGFFPSNVGVATTVPTNFLFGRFV